VGYRAPSFSIIASNLWAFEELDEAGYRYSSSVVPIRHDIYGLPEAPRHAFTPAGTGLVECPVTTLDVAGRRWSFGGGGHFRILPYHFFTWGMRRVNREERLPCFFYFHPWEVDPEQPRIPGARLRSRLRHYSRLGSMASRLRRLMGEFRWGRYDAILGMNDPAP
jgi:polysaccharide deacetylase family protein (PEP-CTERM system associated)